jgi:hypothetical protein
MEYNQDRHVRPWFVNVHYFEVDYCIKTSKEKCVFMLQTSISQSSQQTKSILPRHLEFRTNITQLKPL